MTEHTLVRIAERRGQNETAFTARCSCGWVGPDEIAYVESQVFDAREDARRDHQLHAGGKPVGRAQDERDLPGAPYKPPNE
jgi:hypothetical protein